MIRIDKNSYGTILLAWAISVTLILTTILLTDMLFIVIAVALVLLILALFVTWFFRVPIRSCPGNEHVISSVADGEIVIVEKEFEKEFLSKECMRVCIYMDFFDVHANFWPVTGVVTYNKYHPGKHVLAYLPKSSDLNEHCSTSIRTEDGKELFFKQIAGTFARRVVSYSRPGLPVVAGEQCGVIKFGSRIDIYLPLDAVIKVKVGDKVKACETIIAEI